MASDVDVCNVALSHVGADAVVSSIAPPDGSVEAGHCARFYPIARREAIEMFAPSFAKRRVTLAETTNTSETWLYAYAMPSDCLRPLRILPTREFAAASLLWPLGYDIYPADWRAYDGLFTERGSADFEQETVEATGARILRTNEPAAVMLYLRDVTDLSRFTPTMIAGMGMLLASFLCGPIIKGLEGARAGEQWRQRATALLSAANALDANASSEPTSHVPEHIRARA